MYTFCPRMSQPRTEFIQGDPKEKLVEILELAKRRVCLIADSAVISAATQLKRHLDCEMIVVDGGETCKTREMKQKLEEDLIQKNYNRDTLLIGMGGGSLTDLIGFTASTFMRGVPLILIPTTLLGMVDAAIGGKNGINTKQGKNLIGTIHHPIAVCIDLALLETLPEKEWLNGFSEILKQGLIYNAQIWHFCEKNQHQWRTPENLKQLIRDSIVVKTQVAEEDPEEKGMRRILNFGHTVGHGLELLTNYRMTHGEAVAIGCLAESWLSHHLGYLNSKNLAKILELYEKCGYAIQLPKKFSAEQLRKAMKSDKKSLRGEPRFVMLEKIGMTIPFEGEFCTPIGEKDLQAMAAWMKEKRSK